jgi:hypothetical protein
MRLAIDRTGNVVASSEPCPRGVERKSRKDKYKGKVEKEKGC